MKSLHNTELSAQRLKEQQNVDGLEIEEQSVYEESSVGRLNVQCPEEHVLIQFHLFLHLVAHFRSYQRFRLHRKILSDIGEDFDRIGRWRVHYSLGSLVAELLKLPDLEGADLVARFQQMSLELVQLGVLVGIELSAMNR